VTELTRQRSYSAEDIGRGLAAVVLFNNNTRKAAEHLAGQGLEIPRSTLRNWTESKPDELARARQQTTPAIHARVAEKHTELAEQAMKVEKLMTARLKNEANDLPIRDVSTAQRNAAVASGVHSDKAMSLRGESPHVSQPARDAITILRALAELGQPLTPEQKAALDSTPIEGTAEELDPDPTEEPNGD